MPSAIQIVPISDGAGRREIIKFPFKLYANDPNWVPPFIGEREILMDPKKYPFFEHARTQFFMAKRDGEIVGTVCSTVNDTHNSFHNEKMGGFGFFECIDDQAVADALLNAAEDWAKKQGMDFMRGPMNFSSNDEWGLLVEGFHEPPLVLMTYNPPYYQKLIEAHGYIKAMDMYAYIGGLDDRLHNAPPKVFKAAERALEKYGITIRKGDISQLAREVKILREITNEVWKNNWGFLPISEHEADHLAANLRPIIDPDLVLIAENREGEPIGISFTLPDVHQALKLSGGGRMYPFGVLKFLWYRRKIDQVRLILMGVKEQYRAMGVDAVFYVHTARIALAKGHKRIEGSWVLEFNTMMNRIIERMGGDRYKTYRIYQKNL